MVELQEELKKAGDVIYSEKERANTASKKLEYMEKVTSQRIVESLDSANFDEESNYLASLVATMMEKDDFTYDMADDKVKIKEGRCMLKMVKENSKDIKEADTKIEIIENKVLEKMRRSFRRDRRLSLGETVINTTRTESVTRKRSEDGDTENQARTKQTKTSGRKNKKK